MPMVLKNDKQAIQACIKCSNRTDKASVTLVRLKNTLCMDEIEVSVNLIPEVLKHPELEIVGEPYSWHFDDEGGLL
jgi:hypothetical protein